MLDMNAPNFRLNCTISCSTGRGVLSNRPLSVMRLVRLWGSYQSVLEVVGWTASGSHRSRARAISEDQTSLTLWLATTVGRRQIEWKLSKQRIVVIFANWGYPWWLPEKLSGIYTLHWGVNRSWVGPNHGRSIASSPNWNNPRRNPQNGSGWP